MYYIKLLLRLTTAVFPLFIIGGILNWIGIGKLPYIYHATNVKPDELGFYIFGVCIVCLFATKLFTKNIQYDNPITTWIGGPFGLILLVGCFNKELGNLILEYVGIVGGLYMGIVIAGNFLWLILFKKWLGFPGLKGSGFDSMNKETNIPTNTKQENNVNNLQPIERTSKITNVRQNGNFVNIDVRYFDNGKNTNTGSTYSKTGKLQNWNESSVTIKDGVWYRQYGLKGEIINSWRDPFNE